MLISSGAGMPRNFEVVYRALCPGPAPHKPFTGIIPALLLPWSPPLLFGNLPLTLYGTRAVTSPALSDACPAQPSPSASTRPEDDVRGTGTGVTETRSSATGGSLTAEQRPTLGSRVPGPRGPAGEDPSSPGHLTRREGRALPPAKWRFKTGSRSTLFYKGFGFSSVLLRKHLQGGPSPTAGGS